MLLLYKLESCLGAVAQRSLHLFEVTNESLLSHKMSSLSYPIDDDGAVRRRFRCSSSASDLQNTTILGVAAVERFTVVISIFTCGEATQVNGW